ncbi:DUF7019 family protein [Nonomuraea jabiensis]|uniref:Uncharacterized protein n=1 Tax=Nonomuraea jabiensis TaxID=882448 RepID=A0A7W9GDZ8_9ACTN|nr:SAVMC3_10250 family protein [Nonomuraea jabiensis]MBB5782075.1 hypothetical protein [Nonomuraea jabiensis]
MYISKTKMDDLIEEFPLSFWSRLSGTIGLTIPPVKFDMTLRERPEKKSAVRGRIEKALLKQGKLGPVDDPPTGLEGKTRYIVGDLVMRWAVHEDVRPQIVWFVGSTERTLVALGGRAEHLTGIYQHDLRDKAPESAELKHVEKQVVADLARKIEPGLTVEQRTYSTGHWVHDVVTVHDYWASELADHVRFLAVVEEYCRPGELGPSDPTKAVLLGSPVYLFKIG